MIPFLLLLILLEHLNKCSISSVSKEIQEEYTMYQPEKNIVRSKRREMGSESGEKTWRRRRSGKEMGKGRRAYGQASIKNRKIKCWEGYIFQKKNLKV